MDASDVNIFIFEKNVAYFVYIQSGGYDLKKKNIISFKENLTQLQLDLFKWKKVSESSS